MTLKTILKNFLNYADTLEAQKKLGKDLYEADFQKLKALTEQLKHDKDYASSEGLKEVNRRKNRYKDILPYDYTRVILSEYPGVPGSDFINANYIKGASGSLAYIASQGPLPNTVVDFWRMIWECEVQVIVMACNEQESGKYKCECYWSTDEEKKQYGNINIEFVKWRQVCPDFLVRTLKACWENEERVICQFHYTTWPDHGVPNSVQPILELVRLIRDCQASEAVPVLIHCSAGCGRTGTICAIDYVWGLMRMGKLSKQFNLFNVIADMRRQRIAMVQTKEQYVLVHKAVSSLFEQQLRVIDSHTYENLDEDGEPLILKELKEEDIYEDILEPVILGEKSGEWKVQPFKMIHECRPVSLEPAQVHQSGDAFSVSSSVVSTICNTEADSQIKTEDKHLNFGVSISENVQLEQNINETNNEFESSSTTRNYNTLQKLCREESVKRLISGWNRAAEQTEDAKSGPKELIQKVENIIDIKSPTPIKVINFEHSLSDQKLENFETKEKVMYATSNSKVDDFHKSNEQPTLDKSLESTNVSSKNTSFDDSHHSGKLIGKATVIRRPSIAKLKALFEKSSQEGHESERQRRPLFRSHSHHVSNSSRILTVSDTPDYQNSSSPSTDQSMHQTTQSGCTNVQTSIDFNQQSELSPTYWSQSSSQRHSRHFAESSGQRQKHHDRSNANEACNRTDHHCSKHNDMPKSNDNGTENSAVDDGFSSVARNEEIHKDTASLTPDTNNSQNSCTYHNISTKIKLKQSHSLGHRKDKAPELPAKRKPTFPNSQIPKNKSDSISMATASKENQWTHEKPNKSEQSDISGIKRTERLIKTFFKGASTSQKHTHNVVSQSWSSPLDHVVKESRRNSHEAVPSVHSSTLYKTQSFSDPEQGDSRANELSRHAEKKISLSETSTPQPTSNKHTSSPYQDEGTYTNVNTLAERNIQQIEDKLKSHPRGAIIDLTSRKSYIDEMNLGSGKHFVFRNTIQPVKFSPALESQDLTSYNFKNRKKSENQCKESTETSTSHTSVPKTRVSKAEKTIKDSDLIDAKNLLLHSPPPKSKRNHASKTNSKSNPPLSSSSSSEMLEDKPTKSNQTPSTTHTNVLNSENSRNVQPASNSTSISSYTADRSDPRYFPVTRQTASEAKYECEKQKATSAGRETYGVSRPISSYEPLYSTKQASYAYHKAATNKYLPESYEKKPLTHMPIQGVKYSQESHLAQNAEKEPLYGLQRSASGPQVLPPECDGSQVAMASSDQSNLIGSYHQHSDEIASKHHKPVARYEQNPSFGLYGTVGTPNPYPVGPPKPPRTFHYDSNTVENQYSTEQNIKRDSGRYLVSVASPKHSTSSSQQQQMAENQNAEYRYGERRQPDLPHHETNPVRQGYATSPPSEVPMSRSYPFSHYDSIYGHPRPYGKQFHPDSIEYRNVPVPSQVGNSIYGTVKDKSALNQQCLYGTIKHRNAAISEYENVYGLHTGYKQGGKTADGIYQSINPGHQRSKSEAYARSQKQPLYPPHNPDYSNLNNGGVNNLLTSPTRKVYFDTLQRRHKQRVTWEQRRSHDDMDIQSAQSSRLREQIHARRSMVELDNLEITVASDEGYPEKGFSNLSPLSPKIPPSANERLCETSQKRKSPNCASEFHKDSHLKKNSSSHNKETGSFGETLSKAFGKLTSLTKFNSKDIQSGHGSTDSGGSGPKVVPPSKQKDKEKPSPNCMNQSPKKCRDPTSHSEQWTQV